MIFSHLFTRFLAPSQVVITGFLNHQSTEVLLTGDASKPPFFTLQLGRFHKPQNSGVLIQSTLKSNGFSSKIYPSQVFQQKLLWFDQFSTKKPLVLCFSGFNPSRMGQFQPKTRFTCIPRACIVTKTKQNKYMGVSKNRGTPKSSILIWFSIINHPFWGTPIFGNIHIQF